MRSASPRICPRCWDRSRRRLGPARRSGPLRWGLQGRRCRVPVGSRLVGTRWFGVSPRPVGFRRRRPTLPRYSVPVPCIVLTVIGDDRAGLVHALSDVVSRHSGNWERSQMAELAGSSRALSSSRYLRNAPMNSPLPCVHSKAFWRSRRIRVRTQTSRQRPRNGAWICWATTGPGLCKRCHRSCIVTSCRSRPWKRSRVRLRWRVANSSRPTLSCGLGDFGCGGYARRSRAVGQ